jgi:hypothetical protein
MLCSPTHEHAEHAYVMHSHVMHAHAVQFSCSVFMFYIIRNSGMTTATVGHQHANSIVKKLNTTAKVGVTLKI